jgi:mannose-1-phosphate guanylyltransferase
MQNNVYVAIMAGGIGSRFWPKSRASFPKQFLDILGTGKTLMQSTFDRFADFIPAENIYVVTSEEYVSIVAEQVPGIPAGNILAEPCRKNTAPCIAYISFKLLQQNPAATLIVAPSDHLIGDPVTFTAVCRQAASFVAGKDAFVTLGITPSHPNTGYGYIQYSGEADSTNVYKVKQFTEKPDLKTAKQFVESGSFLWNAGIFIWKVKDIVNAFRLNMPDMYDVFAAGLNEFNTPGEKDAIRHIYKYCDSVSIDVALMEKASNVYVIPADFKWSDLGTWNSAYDNICKDDANNAIAGDNIMVIDAARCMVHVSGKKLVLMQGVEDLIVVDTDDVLMICRKESEQEIKQYVTEIGKTRGSTFL